MNTFMQELKNATNFMKTDNGATGHRSTNNPIYDMFALGGAMRKSEPNDIALMFKNAYEEDKALALRCLFYLRDARGGQGERRFFRICFRWLANHDIKTATKLIEQVPEYGRWDDVLYASVDTPVWGPVVSLIHSQLRVDLSCKTPSLLGKWIPSENASSRDTKRIAGKLRYSLGMSHKGYRQMLSTLRKKINIVERLMSENRWDEIEFDKIPSKAGLIYKNAFARRDIIKKKYEAFAKNEKTTVNAKTLYPYEVVDKALDLGEWNYRGNEDVDRAMIEKYWNNLPDYLNGKPCKMMCVIDTSGSMCGSSADAPINVATSLGMYCAERIGGPFKNHYISFSSKPQLVKIEGIDFVDKVKRIRATDLCENTDLLKTFELIKSIAKTCNPEDVPETLVVISDMQIDHGSGNMWGRRTSRTWTAQSAATEMEQLHQEWAAEGLKLPSLVYWNVNASNPTILDSGPRVSFVSGCSPILFQQILTGKTGYDLMLDKLMSTRYDIIEDIALQR